MASLNRLARDFADQGEDGQGLRLLAVSVDDDTHLVREFVRREPLEFPVLLDPGARASVSRFGVGAFPTTVMVDRQGRIAYAWVGERDWDAAEMRAAIRRTLRD